MKTTQRYYCKEKDCSNEISYPNFLYGKKRCKMCYRKLLSKRIAERNRSNKGQKLKHKIDCKCCICKAKRKETTHQHNCKCFICKAKRGETRGINSKLWKGGGELNRIICTSFEYRKWRNLVYKRDNYICKKCGKTNCSLEAHHIKSYKELMKEFLNTYFHLDPVKDKVELMNLAVFHKPFWNTNNGVTLCKDCHKLTDTYTTKNRWKLYKKD